MKSYLIEVKKDILEVDFNPEVSASGEQLVKDTFETLKFLISSEQLSQTKILKINGHSSVLISYVLAHELGHLYPVIAVYDPRFENNFVVTISYDPNYKVGDIIDSNNSLIEAKDSLEPDISSVTLNLERDTLYVSFNSEIIASGDRIVRDTVTEIDKAISSEAIRGGKLLKINGRISVLASYVIAHKLAHLYGAIAIFDPKLSEPGKLNYIVTIQHGSNYQIGDIVEEVIVNSKFNSLDKINKS